MNYPCAAVDGMELLIDYVSGALPPAKRFAFERHLATCSACARAVEEQSVVWQALDSWVPPSISSDFDAALQAKIAIDQARPWYVRFFDGGWPMRPAMPLGAACAAIIAVFLIGGPRVEERHPVPVIRSSVDMQQVERALDDLDMLQQVGVVSEAKTKSSSSKSM